MRLSPLRLSLLAAVLVHLLVVSVWQLQRSRARPPQRLTAADDTPLLLRFSREEPLSSDLPALPLPSASPLPPPPPGPWPAEVAAGREPAAAAPARSPAADVASLPRRRGSDAAGRESGQALRAGSRSRRPPAGAVEGGRATIPPLLLRPGSAPVAGLEQALAAAGGGAGSEAQGASQTAAPEMAAVAAPASSPPAAEPAAAAALERRLWSLARPVPLPARIADGLPAGLALRTLPLELARRNGVRVGPLSPVRLEQRIVVFWIDGASLWLLSAPLAEAPASGGRGDSGGGAG